eukprot:7590294-Pyramimonas_sp.AAC.1
MASWEPLWALGGHLGRFGQIDLSATLGRLGPLGRAGGLLGPCSLVLGLSWLRSSAGTRLGARGAGETPGI